MSGRRRLRLRTRWWIGIRLSDLPPTTTLVALTLAGWADENGRGARPSLSSIASGCRVTRRAVVTHVKDLDDAGWIRRSSGRGVANSYSLAIPVGMEVKIEAQLGEWTGEVGNGDSLPGDEAGNGDARSRERSDIKWGTGVPTSLQEPPKRKPSSASEPDGSPTYDNAPWENYPGGWKAWKKDQRRSEEAQIKRASDGEETP